MRKLERQGCLETGVSPGELCCFGSLKLDGINILAKLIGMVFLVLSLNDTFAQQVDMTGKPSVLSESSLVIWLDASNINGLDNANAGISNGDAVSTWGDLSGNGNDVSQSSAANQPSYNGTAIEFSGSHFIQSVNTIDITTSAGGESTIFTVLKFDSLGSFGPVYTIEHSSNKGIYHGLYTGASLSMSITHNRHVNHSQGWDDSKSTWIYTSSPVTLSLIHI